jgi:hypothetical protein
MKINVPTWKETEERLDQLKMYGDRLNPLEQFIYDHEPIDNDIRFREHLKEMLEYVIDNYTGKEKP